MSAAERIRAELLKEPAPAPADTSLPPLASDVLAIDRPPIRRYSTGFPGLDERLRGGIPTRAVTGVAGRTGSGKTGFLIGILRHVTRTYGIPVLYVSTELDEDEGSFRFAALDLKMPIDDLMSGRVSRAVARNAIAGLPIRIIGQDGIPRGEAGLSRIRDATASMAKEYGVPPMVGVDYLQQLVEDDPKHVRIGVTEVARTLRTYSQVLDCAIIAALATQRAFYKPQAIEDRDNPLSYLAAAKESGDIEYSVANLLFLDVGTEPADGVYGARIVTAKARRGLVGFDGAAFNGPIGSWSEKREALIAMSGAARSAKATETQNAEDEEKVLATIKAQGAKLSWHNLRELPGIAKTRADGAKARLLADNRIHQLEVEYRNARGQTRTRDGLAVGPAPEPVSEAGSNGVPTPERAQEVIP